MRNRLFSLSILVLLSLIPAVLLYLLFGKLNTAGLQWSGSEAVQLGGPVAAFFITLIALWRMYRKMYVMENPLESLLIGLEGNWIVESKSDGSDRKARSDAKIAFEDGQLRIDGGTFYDIAGDGSNGDPLGSWDVQIAVSDGHRLKYFYTLTDKLAAPSMWRGLVEADLQPNSKRPTLVGRWQVIGKEIHTGDILLTKSS